MLAIQQPRSGSSKSSVNIIPCQIHQTGPSRITKRYWNPVKESDGSQTAYFRGRRLRGKLIKLPQSYHGSILKSTTKTLPHIPAPVPTPCYDDDDADMEEDEEESPEPVKIVEQVSTFDDLIVWGHDQLPSIDDPFVKGIEEWISFAEAIHLSDSTMMSSKNDESTSGTTTKQ